MASREQDARVPATSPTLARQTQTADTPPDSPEGLARARLAHELAACPAEGTPAFWAHVRATGEGAPSLGALVVFLRRAQACDAHVTQRDLFTLILERTAGMCAAWAARVAARTPGLTGEAAAFVREELCQELALYLWEHTARGTDPAWERYFLRSLDFAERHVATRYMQRSGYWVRPGVRQPERGMASSLSVALASELGLTPPRQSGHGEPSAMSGDGSDGSDSSEHFALADLADLRALALELPLRERIVIVLRFWQQASEAEIAAALGGTTTRTVRNIQRRALTRLRIAYLSGQGARAAPTDPPAAPARERAKASERRARGTRTTSGTGGAP